MFPRPKGMTFDRVLKDASNPDSVITRCSPEIAKAICDLPEELLDVSEEDLHEKCPDPSATTMQLRRMFWLEYDRAIETRMLMDMSRVYIGVCSRQGFYKIIQNHAQLAWIVNPPKEYTLETEELLALGLRQVREILKLPLKNSLGFVDTKLAEVKLKAVMMLDMRLKGAYVQRSLQVSHNINENTTTNIEATMDGDKALHIDEKIKQLELEIANAESRKLSQVVSVPTPTQKNVVEREVIDVEFKEVP